jgi:hypothetical protein
MNKNIKLDAVLAKADAIVGSFEESKHPRAEDGKFGSGGGSSSSSAKESAMKTIRSRTGHQLEAVLKDTRTDPKVKKLIQEELDDRGSRGWPMSKANS